MSSKTISIITLSSDSPEQALSLEDLQAIADSVAGEPSKLVFLTYDESWSEEQIAFLANKLNRSSLDCFHIPGTPAAFICYKEVLETELLQGCQVVPEEFFTSLVCGLLEKRRFRLAELQFEKLDFESPAPVPPKRAPMSNTPAIPDMCYDFEVIPFIKNLPEGAIQE